MARTNASILRAYKKYGEHYKSFESYKADVMSFNDKGMLERVGARLTKMAGGPKHLDSAIAAATMSHKAIVKQAGKSGGDKGDGHWVTMHGAHVFIKG
jgi:hypothetical protein